MRKIAAFVLAILLSSSSASSSVQDSAHTAVSDSLYPPVRHETPDTLSVQDTAESPQADALRDEVFDRFALGNEISSEDVDNSIAGTVGDLSEMQSLIDVARIGSIWQLETPSVGGYARGLDVLVDGVAFRQEDIGFPQRGYLDLNTVLLSNVSSMRLLPAGPANMWGEGRGILGLDIETKDFSGDEPYSRATADKGPHGTHRTQVELGRRLTSKGRFYFTAEFKESNGYQTNSDYDGTSLWGKTAFRLTKRTELMLAAYQYKTKMGIPFFQDADYQDTRKTVDNWGIRSDVLIKENLHAALNLRLRYESQDQEIKSKGYGFEVRSCEERFALTATQIFERQRSLIEIEGRAGKEILTTLTTKNAVHSAHLSVADLYRLRPDLSLLLSSKVAKEEGLDAGVSALAGISCAASDRVGLFSTVGTFTGYPTSMDRRWPAFGLVLKDTSTDYLEEGDGSLKLQRSLVADLGVNLKGKSLRISGYVFGSTIDDLVLWSNVDTTVYYGHFKPVNARAQVWGANVDFRLRFWSYLSACISYSYKRGEDSDRNLRLPDSPEHSLFSYVQFENEFLKREMGLKLRLEGKVLSSRFMDEYEQDREPAVGILNAKITVRFLDFHFYYTIRNITDRSYRLMDSSYMPERTYWWGFYWEFYD